VLLQHPEENHLFGTGNFFGYSTPHSAPRFSLKSLEFF